MRKLSLALLLLAAPCFGQQVFRIQKFCEVGGQKAVTQGLNSVTNIQRSFPRCTVTVYLTGTTTIAAVYSDNLTPPTPLANPFTANVDGSWGFYASTATCYDVVTSGGNPGDTFPQPFTYSNICVGGGGGGTGVNPGTPYQVTRYDPTGVNIQDSTGSDNPANGPTRWTNGLSVEGNAGYRMFVNSPAGTTTNLLICRDTSVTTLTQVTTCPANTNSAFGLADNGAGTTGNVRTAMIGFHSCVFDNQTVVGDWVAPSASVAGNCTDAGATKPTAEQVLGHVTTLNTGAATLATVDLFTGDTISGGGAPVTVVPCSIVGCDAYYQATNVIAGDNLTNDDGLGNKQSKSLGLTDSTYAGFFYQNYGPLPLAAPANSILHFPPTSGTVYSMRDSNAPGTAGQCWQVLNTTTDTNGNTIDQMGFGTCGGGGSPTSQMLNPSAPTLSTNGSAGSTSYTYLVVACEDPACVYHTAPSSTTTIATGNATLTSSNSINLSLYGDTLYGARGFIVCRTASSGTPSSIGVITGGLIAGKKFVDTGLAGSGVNCASVYSTNTTILEIDMNANPGCNVPLGGHDKIDSPPCSTNAADDEARWTFGAPGDVNDPFWTWGGGGVSPPIQNSATAVLSGGTIIQTSDTSGSVEALEQALPGSTPYTFIAYVDTHGISIPSSCMLGLRESSTGKMSFLELAMNSAVDTFTATGGYVFQVLHATAPGSGSLSGVHAWLWRGGGAYIKIQNTGAAINYSYSLDGIGYQQLYTEAPGTPFTTAPNQLLIGTRASGTAAVCVWDYVRRTQ